MGKLVFQELMSGTRVTTEEEIGELSWIMEYKDTPEWMRKHFWWSLNCISMEFQGWDEKIARHMWHPDQVITDINISKEAKDLSYIRLNADDMKTYWVKINRPDLFAELVEYFKGEDIVFSKYIRWFH
jgi:hypothetical protein